MKKLFLSLTVALCTVSAMFAQERGDFPPKFDKEQFLQIKCNEMADNLALIGQKRENFIKMYSDFTKAINDVARTRVRTNECQTEEEVEKAILKNFEVSDKILEIRKNYYSKFKTILAPSQIQLMYQSEFSFGRRPHDAPGAMPPPPEGDFGNNSSRPL